MNLLQVKNISKLFNGVHALENLSFDIRTGEIVGLIGPNGSGKSTFFNVLTNILRKDTGRIIFDGIDITNKPTYQIAKLGIARTFQDAKPLPQITVRENLDIAFDYPVSPSLYSVFAMGKILREEEIQHGEKISELLRKVNLQDKETALAEDLSYGQGKLLEILKIIASDSKLILLDEPFSGLFPEMIRLITGLIKELSIQGKTVVLVEHNMKLISEICDHVIVLDAGKKIAEGKFAEVTKQEVVIESYLGK